MLALFFLYQRIGFEIADLREEVEPPPAAHEKRARLKAGDAVCRTPFGSKRV